MQIHSAAHSVYKSLKWSKSFKTLVIIMLFSGLKNNQIWLVTALLLISFSICPRSCYPHAEEDEDEMEPEDNGEGQEPVRDDDDQNWEQEEEDLMDDTDVEDDHTEKPADCIMYGLPCEPSTKKGDGDKCCGQPDRGCPPFPHFCKQKAAAARIKPAFLSPS